MCASSARLWIMPLLMAMSGCGADAPGSCTVRTAVDVPLLNRPGLPTVIGQLGDQKVALMLDTGAALSVVTPGAVERFGLTFDADHVVLLTGIGGTTRSAYASIHSLELGHGHAFNFDLPIAADLLPDDRGLPLLGLFGADFMSNYDVDFDLPHHHFGMYTLTDCGDAIQPVQSPYFTVPFRLDGTAIKVEIQLNGVPVEAQLDSGASRTYVTRADASRAGVTPEMLAADTTRDFNGVDASPVQGHLHHFASLELGAERLRNFPLAVAPSADGDTLLGDDFFRLNRIWISYSRRMLFIQPATSDPRMHMVARIP